MTFYHFNVNIELIAPIAQLDRVSGFEPDGLADSISITIKDILKYKDTR